jgi:hypothetical protein
MCRHRGAVIGCRAPQTLQSERGLGRPAGAAVVVAVEDARTPATPFVALSAVRTSVHLVAWTAGVQATGVHATGVIHVSGQPGVRTARRPVSVAAASALSGRRWIPDVGAAGQATLADRVRRVAVVPSGLVVAARIRPGGDRWLNVGSAWLGTNVDGRPGPPLRSRTGCGAALAAWPTKRAGPAPGCRSVGWGAREGAGAHKSPAGASWVGCRRTARHGAGPEGGDHARWSLSWCWSRVVRLWRARPVQRGVDCGRAAAAACEARCPLGADSTLTS